MNGETLFANMAPWQDPRSAECSSWILSHNPPNDYDHSSRIDGMTGYSSSFNQHFRPFQGHSNGSYDRHNHRVFLAGPNPQLSYSMPQNSSVYPPLAYATPPQQPRPSLAIPYGYNIFTPPPSGCQPQSMQFQLDNSAVAPCGPSCNVCQTHLTPSPSSGLHLPSPTFPRGPPRKPKRSGHAVWVGNIPLGASIEALKDHFAKDATADIESVFLMGKSNCAFINYQTEAACVAAVDRFNHSLFGSVRLLCRLRRDPSGRNASGSPDRSSSKEGFAPGTESTSDETAEVTHESPGFTATEDEPGEPTPTPTNQPLDESTILTDSTPDDKYFIVKSLTKEDLQESLQRGTWETQFHNQKVFAKAYRDCSNVYLIFSVNKSGEYFGYARMISPPSENVQSAAVSPSMFSPLPREIPPNALKVVRTPATDTAPKGYIIEDSTRGTLFWEAEHDLNSIVSSDSPSPDMTNEARGHVKSLPFKVEWLSVRRVTFQRTKGIKNPWNSNKEVKVARDGTELETDVGRRLVALFHEQYEGSATKRGAA